MQWPAVKYLNFDRKKFSKTLNKRVGGTFREALRSYFRALLSTKIPVETGMAKAAVVSVIQELGRVAGTEIQPTREPYFSKLEGVEQNIENGIKAATHELVDDKNNSESFIFYLTWDPGVLHFWTAEYYNGSQSGEAREKAASEAFLKYIRNSRINLDLDLEFE